MDVLKYTVAVIDPGPGEESLIIEIVTGLDLSVEVLM